MVKEKSEIDKSLIKLFFNLILTFYYKYKFQFELILIVRLDIEKLRFCHHAVTNSWSPLKKP